MRRINLSTRPFYNERAVHLGLGALAAIVFAVTVFNLWEVYVLSRQQADLQGRVTMAQGKTREFRDQASRIRGSINPRDLDATIAEAREANVLIERRVFSWTDLFNRFEETLPPNVRISAVRPRIERDGTMVVEMSVVARTVEGVNTFVENLEKSTAFRSVLSREEFVNPDGFIQASLEGQYLPAAHMGADAKRGGAR
jgi:hypothetical protein